MVDNNENKSLVCGKIAEGKKEYAELQLAKKAG